MLLPLARQREHVEDIIENVIEMWQLLNPHRCVDDQITTDLESIKLNKQSLLYMADYLRKFEFLETLSVEQIQTMLFKKELKVITLQKDEIVPVSRVTDKVYLVINGRVMTHSHSLNEPSQFTIVQVLT